MHTHRYPALRPQDAHEVEPGSAPVPFMPVLSRILSTMYELPSSSFLARMSELISIRKLSSSPCAFSKP